MKILLDANALMMPAQFQIDLFDELRTLLGAFEPLVLSGVVRELTGSQGQGGVMVPQPGTVSSLLSDARLWKAVHYNQNLSMHR